MSDDLGYGEVSWTPGPRPNRNLTTPHVDALARSGMSFVQAYAGSPVCAPSRGTLMTGKHTGHATIRGNHAYDGSDFPLAADDVTFLSVLQAHGYATACVGKWGMGWIGSTGDPSVKGCETYFGVLDQNDAHDMYPSEASYTNRFPASNGSRVWELVPFPANANASRAACMAAGSTCVWSHELWTEAALAALASLSAAQPPRPFFLYLSYTDPHAGGWSGSEEEGNPVPSDGAFAGAPWPTVEVDHASVIVNYQDRDVGALVAAVAAAGIANTTAIIFASDNGASNEGGHDYAFFDSSGPLRGFKRCLTEGGTRTPLVVSLPGTIAPGVVSNFTTAFWDMGDTILDLAGVPPAAWLNQDGRSIKHVLLSPDGRGTPGAPPHIQYTEFCTAVHPPLEPRQGVGWGHSVVNGEPRGAGRGGAGAGCWSVWLGGAWEGEKEALSVHGPCRFVSSVIHTRGDAVCVWVAK